MRWIQSLLPLWVNSYWPGGLLDFLYTNDLSHERPLSFTFSAEFSGYVDHLLEQESARGVAVAVFHNGMSVTKAWGTKSEGGARMDIDVSPSTTTIASLSLMTFCKTLVYLASTSKAFLSSAMSILIEDFALGRNITSLPGNLKSLSWETKVQDLLPGKWQLADASASERVNIRDILTHVSGEAQRVASDLFLVACLSCTISLYRVA